MKKFFLLFLAIILLSYTVYAINQPAIPDYSSYHTQTKEEMKRFFDENEAISMPYGLPDVYCPEEVTAIALKEGLSELGTIVSVFDEWSDLKENMESAQSILVGGYQDLNFNINNKDKFLQSDGNSLLDITNVRTIWYFILYTGGEPTRLITVAKSPSNPQYHLSGISPVDESVTSALIAFAEKTKGVTLKSPVFITRVGSDECIVVADTSDGEKALVSTDTSLEVYDVSYVIGFEQERIRRMDMVQGDSSVVQGNTLSYKDFVPMSARGQFNLMNYLPIIIILIITTAIILLIRNRRALSRH